MPKCPSDAQGREAQNPEPPAQAGAGRHRAGSHWALNPPRCANCPLREECPHGPQLCDHSCCSDHPDNEAYMEAAVGRKMMQRFRAGAAGKTLATVG